MASRSRRSAAHTSLFSFSTIALCAATFAPIKSEATTFEGRRRNGTPVRGEFVVLDAGIRKAQTTLFLGNVEIPRVRPYCYEDFGGYRCPHRSPSASAEVYPRVDGDGELRLHVIFSNGSGSEAVTLSPATPGPA